MLTFIMLTRLNTEAVQSPSALEKLEREAMSRVQAQCPDVKWICSYAALGPYDYVDIFQANDIDAAAKVSTLIRSFGHAHTEIWPATEWEHFKQIVRELPAGLLSSS
jgi:uncharacterized protein with GYD domain